MRDPPPRATLAAHRLQEDSTQHLVEMVVAEDSTQRLVEMGVAEDSTAVVVGLQVAEDSTAVAVEAGHTAVLAVTASSEGFGRSEESFR